MSVSNAYWKGDAQNQPMQRIYGTAFFKDDELKQHLHQIEEAKKRDHRRIGKDIGLFMFHPWAPGAAFWSGKGRRSITCSPTTCAKASGLPGSENAADL